MGESLTLLTLADELDNAVSDDNVDNRLSNMNKVLKKVRDSVASLGYAYGFAEDSISKIIHMQSTERCRNKLMFNEDIEEARRISSICRSVYNRDLWKSIFLVVYYNNEIEIVISINT